jgi:hypothetical protein
VEPEKTSIARQALDKRVPTAINIQTTIEELLEAVFCTQSVPKLYMEAQQDQES